MVRGADGRTRAELLEGYAHPYRRRLPRAWRQQQVETTLIPAVALAAATLALKDSRGIPGWSVALVLAFLAIALVWALIVTLRTVRAVRRRMRTDENDALDALRRARPHAANADDVVAHDEYAATVDDGEVVIWCFMPLAANERAVEEETLIPGTPSYAAAPVERTPDGPGRLADAEETAADWEAQASR
jgi:HAMP domain-containing protein